MTERERPAADPYSELEVDPRADPTAIRRAYHAKARVHHPDRGGDPDAMTRLNVAYEVLRDPVRRRKHDASRPRPPRPGAAPPPWTGAAGPPPGKPSGPVLDFGIFAGWSIGEISRHDPGYLVWLSEHREGRPYLAAIERVIGPMQAAAKDQTRAQADGRARRKR